MKGVISVDAFDLAIRQVSTARLRRLAVRYQKNVNGHGRENYIAALATLTEQQRFEAMREEILAGRGSMVVYSFENDPPAPFEVNFVDTVGDRPLIVTSGEVGEIIPEMQHVQWTMTNGHTTYLDEHLQLRVEPEAIVVDTFYDQAAQALQIRSSYSLSRRIAREWARLNNRDFETNVIAQGLTSLDQVHDFCDAISGRIRKCTGDRLESQGFSRVSGMRAPGFEDLRGTPDYEQFVEAVSMVESQIEFDFEEETAVIGIGLQTRSVVFITAVDEAIIGFVYGRLKTFLNL